MLTQDMKRVVGEQRLGYVATVCPDGTPNLSPKGTTAVWDDNHLVFADIRSPRTIANIKISPSVEINVVDPLVRKGYRFKGTAQVFTEGPLFKQILEFYQLQGVRTRDGESQRIKAIVLVSVERVLPLVSPVYDSGADERDVADNWKSYYQELWEARRSGGQGEGNLYSADS